MYVCVGEKNADAAVKDSSGVAVGEVTSGGFSPVLKKGVAMAYVPTSLAKEGSAVGVQVRDKSVCVS